MNKMNAFKVYSLAELRELKFPEQTWVVEDLIPAGSLTLLVGRPKAGKSLLAIDLLASVALDQPFIGRTVSKQRAIYGPAEDSLALVRGRLEARCVARDTPDLLVMPVDGTLDQWLRIDNRASFTALAQTIKQHKLALAVLDPLREIHNQPENDADAMAAVLRPLRQLAHEAHCAIVIVHHRNKHGADPATAARGSSAIVGSVDQIITLEMGDSGADNAPMSMLVEGRYGPRQRLTVELGTDLRWSLIGEHQTLSGNQALLLARLRRHPDGMTGAQLISATGLAERTVQKHLGALHANGVLCRTGSGHRHDPYIYRLARADPAPGEPGTAAAASTLPLAVESIRTCRNCGGNLWHEVEPEVWRCAGCGD